jgi:transposase
MEHYVGIDASLERSSICVMDASGKIIKETKVASEPEALALYFRDLDLTIARIGLEAGPLSQWLHAGLQDAGFEMLLLETRHVKAALSAMVVKTDRRDARGIAQLLRMGWYRPVHCKSVPSQEIRALLGARKQLQLKMLDIQHSIRGLMRGFGLKLGEVSRGRFEQRVRELADGHAMLTVITGAMLQAWRVLREEHLRLHREVLSIARRDEVCRLLTTVPGVGALVAITFKTAVDDPSRFRRSKAVGVHFGLTPRRYQSGETDMIWRITKVGDGMVRSMLYEAAQTMLTRSIRFSTLKHWALKVAQYRGMKWAKVALARKFAVVLHRMWVDGTEFRWGKESTAAA